MALYDLILEELRYRGIAYSRVFAPPYICSIGAHLFNIHNKHHNVYFELGRVPDMRVHIMFVAVPGFSKSLFIEQFLRGPQAILYDSGIDIGFESIMTEAGFVGTRRYESGTEINVVGAAYEYRKAIVGIEEFSALASMMRAQHSKSLDAAILTALDSGWLEKRLAAGRIRYQTFLSLWAATQPMRFDLTSGLARRFVFVVFLPKQQDRMLIRKARREGRGKVFNVDRTLAIRNGLKKLVNDVNYIRDIDYPESLYKLFDDYDIPHYEEALYERIAIGYEIMKRGVRRVLQVILDEELRRIIKQVINWRLKVKFGAQYAQILTILVDMGREVEYDKLLKEALYYGLEPREVEQLLTDLGKMKMISFQGRTVRLVTLDPSLRGD